MNSFAFESQKAFARLKEKYSLHDQQVEQFKDYAALLDQARTQFNITAIDTISEMVETHFMDSLALAHCEDLSQVTMIADVGTGGGFPGIPLKILYPHISLVLIEVSTKKVDFLRTVINKLQLENIEISSLDWRTFLRKTSYPIDLFVSRASLHTQDLLRLFQPGCTYKNALLVYWASRHWNITAKEKPFFLKECEYSIQNKKRKLIFFKSSSVIE